MKPRVTHPSILALLLTASSLVAATSLAATASEQLAAFSAAASTAPQAANGQRFFTATHGRQWSCSSCHGSVPTREGKHAGTGKAIGALAPAVDPSRFADAAKTEKWFRRNCNDVLGRECSASEKADVLAWLMSLRP
jgi:hypothetical protein